jgi:hypothetical protein
MILTPGITILIRQWKMIFDVAGIDPNARVSSLEFIPTRKDGIPAQPKLAA